MRTKRFGIISRLGTVLFIFGLVMAMNANISMCEAGFSLAPIQLNTGTEVGGILYENTTWTIEGSPYIIIEPIQIPINIILNIDAGVEIKSKFNEQNKMFKIKGKLYANGTADKKIFFDGGNLACVFYNLQYNLDDYIEGNLKQKRVVYANYCVFDNIVNIYSGAEGGVFILKNSILEKTIGYFQCNSLDYVSIEYNVFNILSKGIYINNCDEVYIKNNVFDNIDYLRYIGSFCIYVNRQTRNNLTIKYNSFLNMDNTIILLYPHCQDVNVSENYWQTNDTSIIEDKIYDKKDDLSIWGAAKYLPILTKPHPDTPQIPQQTPPSPPVPPFLVYLNITPAELELGDNVTISVDIRNPNDRAISYGFTLEIGEPYEIQILWIAWTELVDVELEAYESKTVSRTITPTAVGTYNVTVRARTTYNTTVIGLTGNFTVKAPPKPAEFVVTDLIASPSEVSEGEPVTVSVTVTNIGEEEGTHTVKLNIDGLVTELGGWHAVTLEGGVSTTISFTLTAAEGVHTVGVDGLTGGFTVKPKPSFWDEIPGFSYKSIILGLTVVIILLWRSRNV